MTKKLNIAEILKDVPKGIGLYTPLYGEVRFNGIAYDRDYASPIITCETKDKTKVVDFFANGKYFDCENSEILLFPSKENRDWSTFKVEPQFPTTYEDCCKLISAYFNPICQLDDRYGEQLNTLRKLLICRDAWWKVDNDWKPDWLCFTTPKHAIARMSNRIEMFVVYSVSSVLAFRTEEIRDKFLDNFRDLIEKCKELI